MVMDYKPDGNLRAYLQKNYSKFYFAEKLAQLHTIISGLNQIHERGLVHKDFHSGNILTGVVKSEAACFITDLGLCRPASETDKGKVYGVLSYIAPEVLKGESHTKASDIYSFGMVAYEVIGGCFPFYEYNHDSILTLRIYQGLRPEFKIKVPQLLEDLINRC